MAGQVETQLAIGQLLASYPVLLDGGDIAGCADLFTADCVFAVSGRPPVEGRGALVRYFEEIAEAGAMGIHVPAPPLIEIDPGGRTATAWQTFLFVANGSGMIVRGMYRDALVRDGDQWRLARRDIELAPGSD